MSDDYSFFQNQLIGQQSQIYDIVPFINGTGDFEQVNDINVLINSLRNLLLTPLGYYPFDPEYGSLLYKKLFQMADDITKKEIEYEVTKRITRYDPRIKITLVESTFYQDKKAIQVNVHINRNGMTAKISAYLNAQQSMFGLEDAITAVADGGTTITENYGGSLAINNILTQVE